MSEPEDDSIEKFKADLTTEADAGAFLREQLHEEAVNFLRLCVLCAKRIELMDDVWKARQVMLDVTIWATELKTRLTTETAVLDKPKNTAGAFRR